MAGSERALAGCRRLPWLAPWLVAGTCFAQAPAPAPERCGEVVTLEAHDRQTQRHAWQPPAAPGPGGGPVTLVLLAGGSGHLDLDPQGCARELKGNSLVRSVALFNAAGFGTALVDAPSGFHGVDGLGGYRTDARHAQDLGRVIASLRSRTRGAVWVVGTSRGAISAANAAARLSGSAAPDGVVLTSALMAGQPGAKKAWVAQSVFDLPLEEIRVPVLVVGHAADSCVRSPPDLMEQVMARTRGARQQVVTVTGGPPGRHAGGIEVCEGRSPHGFAEQEAEVAAGIARFVRGGRY